ncbi:MAG: hypothetical protein ACLQLG_04395 [Thermoguttaceae bacterium]
MHLTAVALGCLLLGQMADTVPPSVPPAAKPAEKAPSNGSLLSGTVATAPGGAQHRLTPPRIVAQALTLPPGSSLSGQPLALLTVLSTGQDRRQQLELAHAYWRLAEAVADYCFCVEEKKQLEQLHPAGEEAAEWRLARASAAAALQEAEVRAVAAQHELAALMSLAPAAAPPLPADRPHVGSYHTYFKELFGAGPAPDRTRLIDRTLPLRTAAIDAHSVALQASEDSLAAALEAQAAGQGPLAPLLACLEEHRRQQGQFMASVCRYNHDIADYALAVAGPLTNNEALTAMLIRSNPAAIQTPVETPAGGVVPTSATEPAREQPTAQEPTRAVRPPQRTDEDPHLQPPQAADANSHLPLPSTPWVPSSSEGKKEPTLVPHSLLRHDDPDTPTPAAQPPTTRQSNRPISDAETTKPASASAAAYAALVHVSDPQRAEQLTLALCGDRSLPAGAGQAMSLAECLRTVAAPNRLGVIEAYWLTRQRVAQYQALVEQGQWLDALTPLVLEQGTPAAAAMLQLRQSRLDCRAAQIEAQLALKEAQFTLATATGRAADALWPLPSSLPRADQGFASGDLRAAAIPESWALRRWKTTLPLLAGGLHNRAAAVVEADAARAAATLGYPSGKPSLADVLSTIEMQRSQTFTFLQTLADYNQAWAGYTLAVLPPDAPAEALAAALLPPQR